jgi:hypothetical protein
MFFDPSMHSEIARLRHRELLAGSERRRIAKAALADGQKAPGQWLRRPRDLQDPSPTTTACPQGAKA